METNGEAIADADKKLTELREAGLDMRKARAEQDTSIASLDAEIAVLSNAMSDPDDMQMLGLSDRWTDLAPELAEECRAMDRKVAAVRVDPRDRPRPRRNRGRPRCSDRVPRPGTARSAPGRRGTGS